MKNTMVIYGTEVTPAELKKKVAAKRPETLILVSSTRVYGASPSHDLCLDEETRVEKDPQEPERAALIKLEAAAKACTGSRKGQTRLVILRTVHVLGGPHEGVLGHVLRSEKLRTAFGFDPLMQIIHHDDVELAVKLAARKNIKGIFNVCGAGAMPLSELSRSTGTQRIAGIGGIIADFLQRRELQETSSLPGDETRYFIHVEDHRFRKATGYAPKHTLPETVAALSETEAI